MNWLKELCNGQQFCEGANGMGYCEGKQEKRGRYGHPVTVFRAQHVIPRGVYWM